VNKNHNLLVVDDEHGVADLIAEVAESLGFAVTVAHDGSAFHELYRRTDPSVIFLDLKLPGHDGIELLRFLGEEQSTATIFIASGLDQRTLAAAHAVGKQHNLDMGRALAKPLMIDDIEAALKTHVKAGMRVRPEDVRRALADDEFRVHFQPKIDLLDTTGTRMTGVEALARWAAPDGGWIFPDQFIPVAREADLMRDLTDVVAEKSFAAASGWLRRGLDLAISINLDASTLNDRRLPDNLAQLANKYGVPASRVTLEITESAAMAAPEATMDILTRFRLKDFNVSIDDFGTGYSSLVQLYRLPFNELKIDKSFVMDIGLNAEAEIIVEILALLGNKLGLKVCAEGIETGATLRHVQNSGCHLGQGYLFSKPVEAEFIEILAERWASAGSVGHHKPPTLKVAG
jgi:EAL domain-containing protein (putative c-di-GMP-specific phosphodiesterase class I)/CheY-like chemotaxis protein